MKMRVQDQFMLIREHCERTMACT